MSGLLPLAYGLVYAASWSVLLRALAARGRRLRVSGPAVALWSLVALSSVLGLLWPPWLAAGSRDPGAVAHGEVWRLVTSMFLQDGGAVGTVFNLVTLAGTLALVVPLTRRWTVVAGFLVAGIVCNALVLLLLEQGGAGNSMATMCLAVVPTVLVALTPGSPRGWIAGPAVLVVLAVVLALARDQHGVAVTLALLLGLLVTLRRRAALSPR